MNSNVTYFTSIIEYKSYNKEALLTLNKRFRTPDTVINVLQSILSINENFGQIKSISNHFMELILATIKSNKN